MKLPKGFVLVYLSTPDCLPCRKIAPIVDRVAQSFKDKMAVVKLNPVDYPAFTQEYEILSVPNILLFRDGRPVGQIQGCPTEATITKTINEILEA